MAYIERERPQENSKRITIDEESQGVEKPMLELATKKD